MNFYEWLEKQNCGDLRCLSDLEVAFKAGYEQGVQDVKKDCAPLHNKDLKRIVELETALAAAASALGSGQPCTIASKPHHTVQVEDSFVERLWDTVNGKATTSA